MNNFFYDIETGALPAYELETLLPPFDPAEVRTGNLKDPDKVAAKIAEARIAHRQDFFDRAALDPLTARALAIGVIFAEDHSFTLLADEDERALLKAFWGLAHGEMGRINMMVGFNNHLFDLPFLIRRSWKLRIAVPFGIRKGRYWGDEQVDLRDCWQLGDRMARGSLDAIAKYLGVGAKNGEGKLFSALWATDRPQAVLYLKNDLEMTAKVATVLGVHI